MAISGDLAVDLDCPALAAEVGLDVDGGLGVFEITDLPEVDVPTDYVLDDLGTSDRSEDLTFTVSAHADGTVDWSSEVAIDAVVVAGGEVVAGRETDVGFDAATALDAEADAAMDAHAYVHARCGGVGGC